MADWRLSGQEAYLYGTILFWSTYWPPRPDWDHDHCEFCWSKFAQHVDGALTAGYTTSDRQHWICQNCFRDFKDEFEWRVKHDVSDSDKQ